MLLLAAVTTTALGALGLALGRAERGGATADAGPAPSPGVTSALPQARGVVPGPSTAAVRSMREGDSGPRVQAAQYLLKALGRQVGTDDGVFGPRMSDAVKDFQKARGLEPDGVIGVRTWQALTGSVIRDGSQSGMVSAAQILLRLHGHRTPTDGIFDRDMTAAVKDFQTAAGLKPDGIIGPDTWRRLVG
ncbi:peptidoglycan-binding protein [Kitasatospora sp. NPDC096204]|uniref:peptidoglycan-binding domain-containing protein n=1 Tax=Kitasatospora sp. NPDC096204 TaxID=3364094 RepID=UPI00382D71A8